MSEKVQIKRIISLLIAALFAVIFCLPLFACNNDSEELVYLEAENAAVVVPDTASDDREFRMSADRKSENYTSGYKYLSKFNAVGNTVTWIFTGERATVIDFNLVVANAEYGATAFAVTQDLFTLEINGNKIRYANIIIGEGSLYGDEWVSVLVPSVNIKKGQNEFTLTMTGDYAKFNIDYLSVAARSGVRAHEHDYQLETVTPTCTEAGTTHKVCECGTRLLFKMTDALGHSFGEWHYDSAGDKMMRTCNRCDESEDANAPESKYFGEVYSEKNYEVRAVETIFEAEWAEVNTPGGLNNGSSYIENVSTASGGKIVGNISKLRNWVDFPIHAFEQLTVDLVLVAANVMFSEEGIAALDPMSDYISLKIKNTQNGAVVDTAVDLSFVAFPGDDEHNYYNWKYVVVKNVELYPGENVLSFTPKAFNSNNDVSMPNLDVLYIHSDERGLISIDEHYDYRDVEINNSFSSDKGFSFDFVDSGENSFEFVSSRVFTGDITVDVVTLSDVDNLSGELGALMNGGNVRLDKLLFKAGSNKVIIKDVEFVNGLNTLLFTEKNNKEVFNVGVPVIYSDSKQEQLIKSRLDSVYDYYTNKGVASAPVPIKTLEAENAKIYGKSGVPPATIIQSNTNASGGRDVENFGVNGNKIVFNIEAAEDTSVIIALRVACALWDGYGNSAMIGLYRYATLILDGVTVDLRQISLPNSDPGNWYEWNMIVIDDITLTKGLHELSLTCISAMPNIDVLYVFTAEPATV